MLQPSDFEHFRHTAYRYIHAGRVPSESPTKIRSVNLRIFIRRNECRHPILRPKDYIPLCAVHCNPRACVALAQQEPLDVQQSATAVTSKNQLGTSDNPRQKNETTEIRSMTPSRLQPIDNRWETYLECRTGNWDNCLYRIAMSRLLSTLLSPSSDWGWARKE